MNTKKMLKELTEAAGVPGYEVEIRKVIRKHLESITSIDHDKLGSIICRREGIENGPRIMLAGHMDEIGFMVKMVTKKGYIKFVPLGGWWNQVLLAQRVQVINKDAEKITGVIGAKPPHLLSEEKRKSSVEIKDMFIDIGAESKEEVLEEFNIRLGDPIVPICPFSVMSNKERYIAKAWDDRVGCGLFISALKKLENEDHPNTVYGVGTVQEEVGLRGAKTSVEAVKPDIALVLEVGVAGDVPGIKDDESQEKLGDGPTIYLLDRSMLPNLKLRDLVIDTAEEMDIPYQFSTMDKGGTDGGHIHLYNTGVPTLVIGVPTRYIHSHSGIIDRRDYDQTVELISAVIKKLDNSEVESIANIY